MFVVIGNTTVDLYISGMDAMPRFDGDEFTHSSLVFTRDALTMTLGGNGANSAYVLAALGAPVTLCSAIGQDDLSATVVGWLEDRGVDLRGLLRSPNYGTPTTTAIVDAQLNRVSFHHAGPGPTYDFTDVPADVWPRTRALLMTGYTLLERFREQGFGEALAAVPADTITALDIGPLLGAPVTVNELVPFLPRLDYLIANERELAECSGYAEVLPGARALLARGARHIVVKRGSAGALLISPLGVESAAGFPAEARVTVGAGDSFNAGFLFALAEGQSPVAAARFANATAARVVERGRGGLGAPSRAEVQRLLEDG